MARTYLALTGRKVKTCIFVCFFWLVFDTVVHSKSTTMKFLRLMSFGDLGQRSHVSCLSIFSKDFFSETTRPILFKFHRHSSSKRGKKVYIFRLGRMTKMTAMPIYVRNRLLQNH